MPVCVGVGVTTPFVPVTPADVDVGVPEPVVVADTVAMGPVEVPSPLLLIEGDS